MTSQQDSKLEKKNQKAFDKLYQQTKSEMPSRDLDQVILAAAHREIEQTSSKRKEQSAAYQLSFFERWRLPFSIAFSLVFTVVVADMLMQQTVPPEYVPMAKQPTDAEEAAPIEYKRSKEALVEEAFPAREKRELPTMPVMADEIPAVPQSKAELDLAYELNESQLTREPEAEKSARQAELPDADKWAAKIIDLAKEGKHPQAREELRRFMQVYPNYPIKEQIEPLLN